MLRILMMAATCTIVLAQDDAPTAKPLKAGDAVPGNFRAFLAADARFEKDSPKNRVAKMHDLIADNGLNPVLGVFSRTAPAADTPVARLAKQMSALVTTFKPERLGAFVIFLTLDKEYQEEDNRDPKAEAAANLSAQLQTGNVPFGLAAKSSKATAAWGLSDKEEVVVVFYNRMIVKKIWSFTAEKPPTDEDLKVINAYVESELKPKK